VNMRTLDGPSRPLAWLRERVVMGVRVTEQHCVRAGWYSKVSIVIDGKLQSRSVPSCRYTGRCMRKCHEQIANEVESLMVSLTYLLMIKVLIQRAQVLVEFLLVLPVAQG
jgi:hypothetical protein